MEEITSTSNEGSNMKKRNLDKYKEISTKNVGNKDIDSLLKKNSFEFSLNCIACDLKSNVKTADNSGNPVSVSSADTQTFELEEILINSPWARVHGITPEKVEVISKKRKKAKAIRKAEKEAREAEEAESLNAKKQAIEKINPIDNNR